MPKHQPALPAIWLVSDARNDAVLEIVLAWLPRGSGLIFRHYHLPPERRLARFQKLARIARRRGHRIALSGTARQARQWRADAAYGPAVRLARGPALPRLVTAHSLREIGWARRARACGIALSPVFPTRSHPDSKPLGLLGFRLLAARAGRCVIALGGMNAARAKRLGSTPWAAIDGLIPKARRRSS
jgi:thiamine-phosphate pyrophosphorylase